MAESFIYNLAKSVTNEAELKARLTQEEAYSKYMHGFDPKKSAEVRQTFEQWVEKQQPV